MIGEPSTPPEQIAGLLSAQAERHPRRIAAEAEGGARIDYATLDARVTALARRLQDLGVGPEVAVGLCMERSLALLVGMLAIWRAGGVYVPLDPALPRLRIETIVEDAALAWVVVDELGGRRLPGSMRTIRIDVEPGASEPGASDEAVTHGATGRRAAYVIHTSGSTGRPKGVTVEHRSLLGLALAQPGLFDADEDAQILQLASIGFDVSVAEVALALASGGTLHLARAASLAPGAPLAQVLRERAITHLMLTPSALRSLGEVELPALRVLVTGGEPCGPDLIERWSRPGRRLLNVYGTTETTVSTTAFESTGSTTTPPIGRPHAGAVVRILDAAGAPVADGVAGEIAIGGPGVARGYLGDPGLTAARFIPDPLGAAGERLYRTGDLGRQRPDGKLELLGRVDDQLKVRGVRVEPGEIEAVLRSCSGVRDAAVGMRVPGGGGEARLVAWVVAPRAEPSAWRGTLRRRLPESMIPSAFVVVPTLPRTRSGKIDAGALPDPPRARPPLATSFVEPAQGLERSVAAMVAEVVRLDRVGADDDFFDLGGDSLRAARLLARLRDELGVEVGWAELMARPTARALAEAVASARGRPSPLALAPTPRDGALPLSAAQQRLLFLHQLDPASRAYGLPALVRLFGPVSVRALERVLDELVRRHEALRTTFPSVDGVPQQRIAEPARVELERVELSGAPAETREARLRAAVRAALAEPFDLEAGPLWRPCLYRLDAEEHVLALTMHHLVADGWSIGVLVREMAALYGGVELPAPLLQPADVAAWEARRLASGELGASLAFWQRALAGAPRRSTLPLDRPRPATPSHRGARRSIAIPSATADELRALARAAGATPFIVLIAGFAWLLGRRSGAPEVVLGTPVANRGRRELDEVVGFLANTLALRIRLGPVADFRELVGRVRRSVTDAWCHQEVPFERVVAALGPERDTSHQPVFQVLFAFQSPPAEASAGRLRFRLDDLDVGSAPFDLTVQLWDEGDGLAGSILYATELFDAATVDRLVAGYVALLERVAASPDQPLPEPEALPDDVAALLADPAVLDAVIRVRPSTTGERRRVATVALAREASAVAWRPPAAAGIDDVIPVAALPRTATGRIDEHALASLPVVDHGLAEHAADLLRRAGTERVAARVAARVDRPPRLHLYDLLPAPSDPGEAPGSESAARIEPRHASASPSSRRAELARPPAIADGGPLEIPADAPATLPEALLRTVERHGDHELVYVEADGATHQSYATLLHEARVVLGGLSAAGLRPGDRVVLQLDRLRDHYTTFWAAVLGGIVPTTVAVAPVYEAGNAGAEKLRHTLRRLGRPVVVTSRRVLAPLSEWVASEGVRVLCLEELRAGGDVPVHLPDPSSPAFIQLSSGSVGAARCIPETHRAVARHVHALARHVGYGPDDLSLSWLPPDHVAELLMCHVKGVVLGCRQIHVRTELVLAEPLRLLDLMEAHRVTHALSPNFGYRLLLDAMERAPQRRWDLSSIRRVANGAEQAMPSVTREFLRRTAAFGFDPRAMQPGFGMAEVASVVTFEDAFDPVDGIQHVLRRSLEGTIERVDAEGPEVVSFMRLGRPVPGVELRIVDEDGRVVPEATVGRLQIRGGVVMPGYLDDPEANAAVLTADGWLDSGDLAFLLDGRLTITGRAKETVVVRGAKLYCHEVDEVAGAVDGVELAAACAVTDPETGSEELLVCVVPQAEADPDATVSRARARVTERLGVAPLHVVAVERREIERTTSGKLKRAALRRRFESGGLRAAIRRADLAAEGARTLPAWFHRRVWRRSEIQATRPEHGVTLVLFAPVALAERLSAAGCVCVAPGDPLAPSRYDELLAAAAQTGPITSVVHAAGWGTDGPTAEPEESLLELVLLVRALVAHRQASLEPRAPVRLQIVASHAQAVHESEPVRAERALLAGVVESLAREQPELDLRHLDLPPLGAEAAAAVVLSELRAAAREREIAWREEQRWVLGLAPVVPTPRRTSPLRDGSTWLVTGGLGGVAFEVARYLLSERRARLLLVGRTLSGGERATRLATLSSLAAQKGGELRFVPLDVADEPALRRAVAEAETTWGTLDGALHLAGVLDERPLLEEEHEHLRAALLAKVEGTLVLERVLSERPAAALVLFSSTASVLGSYGAGAYAAACRFMEARAHARRRAGRVATWCVAWHRWEDTGMSRDRPAPGRPGAERLTPARGIASLLVALHALDDLIIGIDPAELDLRRRCGDATPLRALEIAGEPEPTPPPLRDRFGTPVEARVVPLPAASPSAADGMRAAPRGRAEQTVAAIWCELLQRDRVGARDNFFDLGGHSLLLARVRARLERAFGREVPILELFRRPTVAALAAWLSDEPEPGAAPAPTALEPTRERAVAIVGMACRLPGAPTIDALWEGLTAGVESVRFFSDEELAAAGVPEAVRRDPRYVPARAVLDDVAGFDAELFGLSPRDAALTDPQHRLFLECAWEALDDAACDPGRYPGRIGVFAGAGLDGYLLYHLAAAPDAHDALGGIATTIGNDKDHLSPRVAYKLDLRGPAITVQSACSTSLVAVHLACEEILAGRCDAALAGGVSIGFPLHHGYLHQDGHILSPDGHCRAFAADAAGTVGGDGAGVVMLKRLDRALTDGDRIHAVVLGTAINNDGARKVGYTAPSSDGQAAVIAEAQARAGVSPADIGFIEAHGTGTTLGDAIEVSALTQVFRAGTERNGTCALGSIKSNLGHLNTAAGVAGLIKAALAVEHGRIPPTLHAATPSPELDPERGPFFVNAAPMPWAHHEGPRRAGVSAFGFGGTNAHVVIEQPPPPAVRGAAPPKPRVLVLSAHGEAALEQASEGLAAHLERHPELEPGDVSVTLQLGRRELSHRRAWVSREGVALARVLRERPVVAGVVEGGGDPPVAFLLPGQGAQHPGMGAALYRTEPGYRAEIDRGCELLRPLLGVDLRELLMPAPGREEGARSQLARTQLAQPALFVVEHALASLWMSVGVRPRALLGHSLGEITAACLAGVFAYEDALALVAARGRLMGSTRPGAMLAVDLEAAGLEPWLGSGVELAADNGPRGCVVAGEGAAIEALERRLAARGLGASRLHVTHAFHTAALDPILEAFAAEVERVPRAAPRIPLLSNVTGTWMTDVEATDPAYWAQQARLPVRFGPAVAELLGDPGRRLLEVGPGRVLSTLALAHEGSAGRVVASMPPPGNPAGAEGLAEAMARLWVAGVSLDWSGAHAGEQPRRVALPSYPFQRQRCWVEAPGTRRHAVAPPSLRWQATRWEPRPAPPKASTRGLWLVLGEGPSADAVRAELVRAGAERLEPGAAGSLDVGALDELLDRLRSDDREITGIVHLPVEGELVSVATLLRALARRCFRRALRLVVATREALGIADEPAAPMHAALVGIVEAARAELPDLDARIVDVGGDADDELVERVVLEALSSEPASVIAWREGERLRPSEPTSISTPPRGEPAPRPLPASARWLVVDGRDGIGLAAAEALASDGAQVTLLPRPSLSPRSGESPASGGRGASEDPSEDERLASADAALRLALGVRPLESHPGLREGLDALCSAAVVRFLGEVGVELCAGAEHDRDELRQRIGVVPGLHRLFDAFLDTLVEDGLAVADGRRLRLLRDATTQPSPEVLGRALIEAHPRFAGIVDLVLHCARSYPEALTGRIEAIGVLYPGGSASLVEGCERRTAEYRSERRNILLLREAVRARVAARRGRPTRILEVGGGQGLLTWPLLSVLRDAEVDYCFTDLGKTFVDDARREAARRGLSRGFRAELLDLSRPAAAQGQAPGSYDLIIAYNVIHAAPSVPFVLDELRTLLAPDGVLGVVEVVRTYRWDLLTWGLAEGWWCFDDELRHDSPLLELDAWERALERAGFDRVVTFPREPRARASDDHGMLWARTAAGPGSERHAGARMQQLRSRGVILLDEGELPPGPFDGVVVEPSALAPRELQTLLALEPEAWPRLLGHVSSRWDALVRGLDDRASVRLLLGPAGSPALVPLRRLVDQATASSTSHRWASAVVSSAALASGPALASALRRPPARAGLVLDLEPAEPVLAPEPESRPVAARPSPASVERVQASRHHRPSLPTPFVAPRSALERSIAAISAELIGVDQVGVQDDFFELGADSLIMLRLSERLGQVLGRPVPREAVFRGATVERLAQALSGQADPAASPLVPIQPGGTRPPLFVAPPASGSTFVYIELAHALGKDQPFYALQALGLDGQAPVDLTVEDMARHYVDAIRTVQPHGPYHLAGFSFGALVAYEMAVQLAEAGEHLGLVALLDEPAPIDGYRPSLWLMAKLIASGSRSALRPLLQDYLYLVDESKAGSGQGLASRGVELVRRFVGRSAIASFVPSDSRLLAMRQPAMSALAELYLLHCRLTLSYEPRAYPYKLTLFKATDIAGARGRDRTQGWRMLAAGGVDVHRVQGDHMTMLRHPNVVSLAARIAACLRATQDEHDQP
ncbi:MAG: amino acid adenylation domain-containing protein [Myxococcales bacterium]|nr:amino acid adenylation domain-containing protein [Myxococcales bacterium]